MPKLEYLQQDRNAANLLRELWETAPKEGAPCVGNEEQFAGEDLPTDKEAALMCATCPAKTRKVCSDYTKAAHPAWGVFDGRVFGRKLEEAMRDDEEH